MATTHDSSGAAERDSAAFGAPAGRDLFLTEICESPSALLGTARTLGEQADKFERVRTLLGGRRLVLTGMGSSADAVTALASVLGRRGVEANTIHTAELLHYRMNALAADSAVVAVSQSGESIEAVRMAAELRKKEGVPLVAVTNGPQSPLAEEAAVSIDLGAGDERGPSSKTYVSTMLAMHVLAEVLTGGESVASILFSAQALAEKAAAGLREWADGAEAIGRKLAAAIDESPQALMVLGRGVAIATAELNALVLKESAHVPAHSMDAAEFRHGPLELAAPGLGVVLVSLEPTQAALDARLRGELETKGASVTVVGTDVVAASGLTVDYLFSSTAPLLDAGCAAIPLLLAAWAKASQNSATPGVFNVGAKVTTCE